MGRAAAAAVSKFTVSARLGDSVSLPCSRATDLVVFRGRHLHHLAQGDRGGFVVSNATQADEGTGTLRYLIISRFAQNSLFAKFTV